MSPEGGRRGECRCAQCAVDSDREPVLFYWTLQPTETQGPPLGEWRWQCPSGARFDEDEIDWI